MTSLNESMADGNTMDKIQFNDGHLDTIFAFVGIALASISGNIYCPYFQLYAPKMLEKS